MRDRRNNIIVEIVLMRGKKLKKPEYFKNFKFLIKVYVKT